jgi:hypothetical protein
MKKIILAIAIFSTTIVSGQKLIIQGITQSNGGTAINTNIPTTPTDYTATTSNCQVMAYATDLFEDYAVATNSRWEENGTYHGWNCYMAHDAPEQWYHVNVQRGGTSPEINWQSDSVTPVVDSVNLITNLVNNVNLALAQAPVGGYDEIILVSIIPEKTVTDGLQDDFIKFWFKALHYLESETSVTIDKIFIVNVGLRQSMITSQGTGYSKAKRLESGINFMATMDSRVTVIDPLQIAIDAGIIIDNTSAEFNNVGVDIHYTWEWHKQLSDYLITQIFI